MAVPFRNAVLRVRRGAGLDGPTVGTGFVTRGSDGLLYGVTCAHVANLAVGRGKSEQAEPPDAAFTCDLPFAAADAAAGKQVSARVAGWRPPVARGLTRSGPVHDIAVLRLDPQPADIAPLALRLDIPAHVAPGGSKVAFDGHGFMASAEGLPLRGSLRGIDAGSWLVLEADGEIGRFIEEGASGAALIGGGSVLGMAVERFELDQRQALAVPALAIAQAFPLLARPYLGLNAFRESAAYLFHGRERAAKALDEALATQGRIAVLGTSGAGKTSLVLAGLLPRRRRAGWIPVAFRPGYPSTRPLLNLAAALLAAGVALESKVDSPEALAEALAQEPSTLGFRLAELRAATGAAGVLIVIDQAEEFFLPTVATGPARVDERARLLAELLRVTAQDGIEPPNAACVLTARTDLLAPLAERRDTTPFLEAPLWLTAMAETELQDAIVEPGKLFGVQVDPALVHGLLVQMQGEAGRLPLLEVALEDLWPRMRQDADGGWRLKAPDNGVPRIEDAIAARAEQVVSRLSRELSRVLHRALAQLVRVVGEGEGARGARRVVSRAEVSPDEWAVLLELARARLVAVTQQQGDGEPGSATAELVHDALIGRWQPLRDIVGEDAAFLRFRDGLDADRRRWEEEGRQAERLLPQSSLAAAKRWLAGRPEAFSAPQRAFIEASGSYWRALEGEMIERAQQAARRSRRIARLFGAGAMAGLMLAGAAWLMFAEAQGQRTAALRAGSRILADRAREALRDGDPEKAYLIAAQAAWWPNAEPLARRAWAAETDEVLLEAARLLASAKVEGGWLAPNQDGSWIASFPWTQRDRLVIYRAGTATPERVMEVDWPHAAGFDPVVVSSADRRYMLVSQYDWSLIGENRFVVLDLAEREIALPAWPFGCYATELEADGTCAEPDPRLIWSGVAPAQGAVLRDGRHGSEALLRLEGTPVLLGIPLTPAEEAESGAYRVSPDGTSLLRQHGNSTVLFRISAGSAGPTISAVERFEGLSQVAFIGNQMLASIGGGQIRLRKIDSRDSWRDAAALEEGRFLSSLLETSGDGRRLVVNGLRSAMLFEHANGELRPLPLPEDVAARLLNGGRVLEASAGTGLRLLDLDAGGAEFLDAALPFAAWSKAWMPDEGEGRFVILQGDRSLVAWQRQQGEAARRVGRIIDSSRFDPIPRISRDGGVVLVAVGADVAIVPAATLLSGRGASSDPVPAAEQRLTRCLLPEEAAELTGLPSERLQRSAPKPSAGRHACPSLEASVAQPRTYWDFWRPLARALLATLSETAGPH